MDLHPLEALPLRIVGYVGLSPGAGRRDQGAGPANAPVCLHKKEVRLPTHSEDLDRTLDRKAVAFLIGRDIGEDRVPTRIDFARRRRHLPAGK
ncbi:hypothetical protein D3C80_1495860 [compost metagenome]